MPAFMTRSFCSAFLQSNRIRGCRFPSPAWKTLGIFRSYFSPTSATFFSTVGRAVRGYRAIADQVAGAQARHGPEGPTPPGPKQGPLPFVLGDPHLPRTVLHAQADDGLALGLEVILQPVDFNDEHRRAVHRQAAMNGLLHGLDHQLVHHLQGSRGPCRRHDGGNRLAAAFDAVVDGQHRLHPFGQTDDPHHHFCAHAEGAFAPDENPREVVLCSPERLAPCPRTPRFPHREHDR